MRIQFKMIFYYVFYLLIYLNYEHSLVSASDKRGSINTRARATRTFFCSLCVLAFRPLSFFAEIRNCLQSTKALSHKRSIPREGDRVANAKVCYSLLFQLFEEKYEDI